MQVNGSPWISSQVAKPVRLKPQFAQGQIPLAQSTPLSAMRPAGDSVRFSGGTVSDAKLLEHFPPGFMWVYEQAYDKAADTGASAITAEHLLWGMLNALETLVFEAKALQVEGNKLAPKEQALMEELAYAFVSPKASDMSLSELVESLRPLRTELEAGFAKGAASGAAQKPLSLDGDVRTQLIEMQKLGADYCTPKNLVALIRLGAATVPSFRQVSALLQQRSHDMTDGEVMSWLQGKAPVVEKWASQALTSGENLVNGKVQIGSLAHLLSQAISQAKQGIATLSTPPRTDEQRAALSTLNALLPPRQRSGLLAQQMDQALNNAAVRLKDLDKNQDVPALQKASRQTMQLLQAFVTAPDRVDYSPSAFVAFLQKQAGLSGASDLKALNTILKQILTDAKQPPLLSASEAEAELKKRTDLMNLLYKGTSRNELFSSAAKIAQDARASQIEPKHLVLAVLRFANELLNLNNGEFVTASPDQVKDTFPKYITPHIPVNFPARLARVALDSLLPAELRTDMSLDQLKSLLSSAEDAVDRLVYQDGKQLGESSESRNIAPSNALLKAITLLSRERTPRHGDAAHAFVRILRETLSQELDEENVKVGQVLNRLVDVARSRSANIPNISFDDVGGYEDVVAQLKKFADMNKGVASVEGFGISNKEVSRGAVLYGPPGNGKTYMAKALANYLKLPFFSFNGAEFGNSYINSGAMAVREMFKQARKHEKSLVFIDEADSLLKSRFGEGHDEDKKKVNTFLSEMDGLLDENPGTIVVTATNNMKALDPAVLRPGRLNTHIEVKAPTAHDREQILKVHTRKKPLAKDVNLQELAELARGRSSAELGDLAYQAALAAHAEYEAKGLLGQKEPQIEKRHFEAILAAQRASSLERRAKTAEEFRKVLEEQKFQADSSMSEETYQQLQQLIEDFDSASSSGGDKAKYERRLDYLLNKINWVYTPDNLDVPKAKAQMEQDHTGLEKPKAKILKYLAVQKNRAEQGLPPSGKVMAMVGPPGVGKTSLAQSLGAALGRKVVSCKLGGVSKSEEIKGHSSTYVGSLPGKIAEAIASAGSSNPIIVLDELDKVGPEAHAVLMELLDPKQNNQWNDNFLGVPLDLSKVMFVATANDLSQIPGPLRDRLDMIELEDYDVTEKMAIAKNHLVGKRAKEVGLKPEEFNFSDSALETLINQYTREAGVRSLERKIGDVAEHLVTTKAEGKPLPAQIESQDLSEILGPSPLTPQTLRPAKAGLGNGLYVMGSSGGVGRFLCKVTVVDQANPKAEPVIEFAPGTPSKNFKDMTHDSVYHALNWVTSNPERLKELGFDAEKYRGKRLQITMQSERGGGMDGDSAGAVMTATMVSALTGRKFRHDLAMTGTITILDEVLAIGGLKQKLRGAMDAGMRVVYFPAENLKDYHALPDRLKQKLQLVSMDAFKKLSQTGLPSDKMVVVPVSDVNDILDTVLLPEASQPQLSAKASEPASAEASNQPKFGAAARKRLSVVA